MNKQDPHVVAKEIYRQRYPAADCLFLAGSVLRNEATAYSDLDIVVLFGQLANAYRESFTFSGWPVEAFVHDLSTLRYFFEQDKARGKPSLPHMAWREWLFQQRRIWQTR